MTAITARADAPISRSTGVVVAVGCGALMLRPQLLALGDPVAVLALLFVALLTFGLRWPGIGTTAAHRALVVATMAAGIGVFLVGRLVAGGDPSIAVTPTAVVLLVVAAIAEEAFFRRLVYDWLAPLGVATSVVGSAWLFAIVHVTVYGWWVVPLDLAAGLIFSWQRSVSGTWSAPAVTHVVANLLVVL